MIRNYFIDDVINGIYIIEEYEQLKYLDSSLQKSIIVNLDIKKVYSLFYYNTFTKSKDTNIYNLLLSNLIERINDVDSLLYFKAILDNEQFKFDLIDDKNSNRKHTFKLYSEELKQRIADVEKK